jgi:hypothetical protein
MRLEVIDYREEQLVTLLASLNYFFELIGDYAGELIAGVM